MKNGFGCAATLLRPRTVDRLPAHARRIAACGRAAGPSYESGGSVYFDARLFDDHADHHYAKLEPRSAFNVQLVEEGEGPASPCRLCTIRPRVLTMHRPSMLRPPARRQAPLAWASARSARRGTLRCGRRRGRASRRGRCPTATAGRAGTSSAPLWRGAWGAPQEGGDVRQRAHGEGAASAVACCATQQAVRRQARRALGRHRPRVPAPRQRAGAGRGPWVGKDVHTAGGLPQCSRPRANLVPSVFAPGVLLQRPVGQLLLARGPPPHRGPEDVQVAQELYLYQGKGPERPTAPLSSERSTHPGPHGTLLVAAPHRTPWRTTRRARFASCS